MNAANKLADATMATAELCVQLYEQHFEDKGDGEEDEEYPTSAKSSSPRKRQV